mgnify:CR=1 FL=1
MPRPERLRDFAVDDRDALVQLTAASVDGRLGRRPRETSLLMLELGLAHLLASDAHAPSVRAIRLSNAVESIGDPELGRWLTEECPPPSLPPEPLPQRPASVSPGRSRRAKRR